MKAIPLVVALTLFTAPTLACNSFGPDYDPTPCPPDVTPPPVCVSPALGCEDPQPMGPVELCLPEGCTLVSYSWLGDMALAGATLPNGYPVIGWSGPCLSADRAQCPNILMQAWTDLQLNALRANRAQSF